MCRSKAQGGRRCRCTDGGASRRAKDRARKAAKRAADRALLSGVGSPTPDPSGTRLSYAQLAQATAEERAALVSSQREVYGARAASAAVSWKALEDWEPDVEAAGSRERMWQQRVFLEREHVGALQDAGRAMATVVDARTIDRLAEEGLSPTPDQDYERIAKEVGGAKFLKEMDRRKELLVLRSGPDFGTLPVEEREAIKKELRDLDSGASGTRFTTARLAWLDADARREEIRSEIMRDELARSVPCGGVPLTAAMYSDDRDPGYAATTYGWNSGAPEGFTDSVAESWQTYPDALLRGAQDRMGDVEVHYSSAGRVRFHPHDLRRGHVTDAVVMHYPPSVMDGIEGLARDAEQVGRTGTVTSVLDLPVSLSGMGTLFADKAGYPVDVGAVALDDTPEVRRSLEDYIAVVNSSGGVAGADGENRDLEVVEVPRSSSMSTAKGLVLATSDPGPSEDPETLRGTGPMMTTSGKTGPTLHELGHYVEAGNPQIYAACRRFRDDRCDGFERTEEIPGVGKVCSADLVDPYVSVVYPEGRTTEVFTTGVEALFTDRYGGLTGNQGAHDIAFSSPAPRPDEGHRELVMGLLMSAGKRVD